LRDSLPPLDQATARLSWRCLRRKSDMRQTGGGKVKVIAAQKILRGPDRIGRLLVLHCPLLHRHELPSDAG
jgi:hypothetical protein